MDLSKFIGKPIMYALEKIKLMSHIVEYSKVEGDEFVKAPELGFYLQSKDGTGIVSAYRIYLELSPPYYPASEKIKGNYSTLVTVGDAINFFGQPIKDIPSIKIPGGGVTLPGKKFIYKNINIFVHYKKDNSLSYIHVKE